VKVPEHLDRSRLSSIAFAVLWASIVLAIGLIAAFASSSHSAAAFAIAAGVLGAGAMITLFAINVNVLYGVAFAALPMTSLSVPGVHLPVNELLLAVALVVATLQNTKRRQPIPLFPKVACAVLIAAMAISAALNNHFDLESAKRLGHLGLYCGLIFAIGAGLLPRRVIQKGMLIGLGLASAFGILYLVIGQDPYGYTGRLTGLLFADPNPAALAILALGFLSIEVVRKGAPRNWVFVLFIVPFLLAQSRSSLVAAAMCFIWWILARRLRPAAGIAIVGGTAAAISLLPTTLQDTAIFGSRSGSDALRSSILSASLREAGSGFWYGNGPGTAKVTVTINATYNFYFHNSYLAVVSEGGIVAAVAVVSLMLFEFVRLISLPVVFRNTWIEMALIVLATAGFHLGEVLLDLPAAVVLGFCINWIAQPRTGQSLNTPTLRRTRRPGNVLVR
jgi:hypothetical protein